MFEISYYRSKNRWEPLKDVILLADEMRWVLRWDFPFRGLRFMRNHYEIYLHLPMIWGKSIYEVFMKLRCLWWFMKLRWLRWFLLVDEMRQVTMEPLLVYEKRWVWYYNNSPIRWGRVSYDGSDVLWCFLMWNQLTISKPLGENV